MKFNEFIRKQLMRYFIIVTAVTFIMGVIGLQYESDAKFGYEAFFSPLLFGLIGVIPSFITFSRKELKLKQLILRKVLQLLVLEILILSFGNLTNIFGNDLFIPMAISIFIVFLGVHVIEWLINQKKAQELTLDLKNFQKSNYVKQ